MTDKQKMQADGKDGATAATHDGTNDPEGAGQSQGGAYPNPHTGKTPQNGGFMGHGGQSEIGYHGHGQLGDEDVEGEDNQNSGTKKG